MLYIRYEFLEDLYMHVVLRSIEDVTSISWILYYSSVLSP